MNWLIIMVAFILAVSLIAFLVIRNQKDKKKFLKQLNHQSIDAAENPETGDLNDKIDLP